MGEGTITSSPSSTRVSTVQRSASMPPTVMQISLSGSISTFLSVKRCCASLWRKAGKPVCRVYLPMAGLCCKAFDTAAIIAGGVAKDGTPWPKETQSPTCAAAMAMFLVAEGAMAVTLRLMGVEGLFMGKFSLGLGCCLDQKGFLSVFADRAWTVVTPCRCSPFSQGLSHARLIWCRPT